MLTLEGLLRSLTLEPVGEGRYRADNADTGHAVIFGGQLIAQSVVAALIGVEGKTVKTVHSVFARGGSPDAPVDITVEPMHSGRSMASSTVTISQGDRLCVRSLVLLSADEPHLVHHEDEMPSVPGPDDSVLRGEASTTWEVRWPHDVDISTPELVGPPDLDVWTRFVGAPDDPAIDQALLGFATDGFLIATAMRPHEGVGQSQAHVSLATGVLSHTLTFHERFSAADWMLLSHHSGYAGHGRCYGRANVFSQSGALVASFVQDAMIRSM